MSRHPFIHRWTLAPVLILVGLLPALTAFNTFTSNAQEASRTFQETGKAVSGKFLQYWDSHGGLAQQGYPISEEMQELSETDGKTYRVQYFERAVFELHPENQSPNDVLLSLLGVFLYKQKYPGGAPAQTPNNEAGSVAVSETGKRLGGIFLEYWRSHGGLAQQGFPISDEFNEVSDLDGKTYRVQYFERAVFEYHPENQAPYNVLLSQLGTFRYRDRYLKAATPAPSATAVAEPTATEDALSCPETPPDVSIQVHPKCLHAPGQVMISGGQFQGNELVSVCLLAPNQTTCYNDGVKWTTWRADRTGRIVYLWLTFTDKDPKGMWTAILTGKQSGNKGEAHWTNLP